MNEELLKSKKFRAALASAVAGFFIMISAKFGLEVDTNEAVLMAGVIVSPFLVYITGEAYSEKDAKAAVIESQNRENISQGIINNLMPKESSGEEQ